MKWPQKSYSALLLAFLPLALCYSDLANAQQLNVSMQTAISSQDADGMTRRDMTPEFLKGLENYTRQQLEIKTQAYLEENGVRNQKVIITVDGVYLEAGGQKLAVIRASDQFDMSRMVIISGITGNEFRRVLCTRATKDSIPISYGQCADKIKEAFGVTLAQ